MIKDIGKRLKLQKEIKALRLARAAPKNTQRDIETFKKYAARAKKLNDPSYIKEFYRKPSTEINKFLTQKLLRKTKELNDLRQSSRTFHSQALKNMKSTAQTVLDKYKGNYAKIKDPAFRSQAKAFTAKPGVLSQIQKAAAYKAARKKPPAALKKPLMKFLRSIPARKQLRNQKSFAKKLAQDAALVAGSYKNRRGTRSLKDTMKRHNLYKK